MNLLRERRNDSVHNAYDGSAESFVIFFIRVDTVNHPVERYVRSGSAEVYIVLLFVYFHVILPYLLSTLVDYLYTHLPPHAHLPIYIPSCVPVRSMKYEESSSQQNKVGDEVEGGIIY